MSGVSTAQNLLLRRRRSTTSRQGCRTRRHRLPGVQENHDQARDRRPGADSRAARALSRTSPARSKKFSSAAPEQAQQAAAATMAEVREDARAVSTNVQLEIFEGPLDLLLHLIKKNEVSITDIPIATITEQYLATLELMETFSLDVAGEFLVMAATLIHIKSRDARCRRETRSRDEDEGVDPRDELVRRLLEYQRYKEAAAELEQREILTRDVFVRATPPVEESGPRGFREVSVFELLGALKRVIDRLPKDIVHEVTLEKITVREKMTLLLDRLRSRE